MPEDNRYTDNRYSYISNQSNEESQRSTQHGNIKRLVFDVVIRQFRELTSLSYCESI